VFKAGFLFSARAGSGVVIAKLDDGSWSAPSAIGTAGMGFGGQLGAEMTDFLIVLNSRAAVKSFMAAGSLTLGGNMSVAVGPLGRNGEASGSLNTNGKVSAMYSYSKTKGLFGGVSLEGSIIIERQDANALAYDSDVTAKMLLSGTVPPPEWASIIIKTLESCTGLPGARKWVQDPATPTGSPGYAFQGIGSPTGRSKAKSGDNTPQDSRQKDYFSSDFNGERASPRTAQLVDVGDSDVLTFDTAFASDFRAQSSASPFKSPGSLPFKSQRSLNQAAAPSSRASGEDRSSLSPTSLAPSLSPSSSTTRPYGQESPKASVPFLTTRPDLAVPLDPSEGVGRAIALHDFDAVEPGDLQFSKGDIIVIVKKTDRTNDWWKGRIGVREGNFPANYVEVV